MAVSSKQFFVPLTEILGITHLTNVEIQFSLNSAVRARVEFLLSDVQTTAILNLIKDCKVESV